MRPSTPAGSATGSAPKTRTEPASALSKPSTCLMSVVLPAPLAPTSPNTMPRGNVRLTLSSAALAPKRRVRPLISTTGSRGAIMESLLLGSRLHGLVALAHELNQFIRIDVHLASFR